MNKSWFYLGVIASLAMFTTSCGGDSGKPPAPAASPSAAASPATSPAAAVPPTAPATPIATTAPAPTVAATPPTVPGKSTAIKPVSVDVAAGLIAPTDGDNWAKTVSKGRTDPFAMLTIQPIEVAEIIDPLNPKPRLSSIASNNSPTIESGIKVSTKSTKASGKQKIASKSLTPAETGIIRDGSISISTIPRTGINRVLPKITVAIKATKSPAIAKVANNALRSKLGSLTVTKVATNNVLRPVNVSSTTSKTPGATDIAAKPKAVEQPLQAMALEISGVIEVEGKTQVIVKLPTESFSRYIEVGNRVADGKVLIKRIESQESLSPTVVLEEVGVEVSRKIGDKATANNPTSQANPK
jgi:hypothetical protein